MTFKRVLLSLGVILFLLSGCGNDDTVTILTEQEEDVIEIPILLQINPETGEEEYVDLVEGFNEKYSGKYRIEAEWINVTAQGYRERLKMLNAFDKLPIVIQDAAFSADFRNLMLDNGRFVNLYPYIEGREEWQDILKKASNEEVYFAPINSGLFSSAGLFYNKNLFKEAGIEEFPETWEDFFECLDTLEKKGITPLALHGGGEYWAAMLISTAYMSSAESGKAFLEEYLPSSYANESTEDMLTCMDLIYDYTFEDALEINFNQAQQRFEKGEVAILANGYWMLQDLDTSEQKKIGFAPFPGNSMMIDEQMSSWAVITGYPEEQIKGAVEFLTYRQENSAVDEERASSLEKEYIAVFEEVENSFVNYQFRWEDQLLNDFFNTAIPELIQGNCDSAEFIEQMDEKLKEIKEQGQQ